ncbi:MAG: hypothetical protein ACR2O1_16190 [Boseongicola sp.]
MSRQPTIAYLLDPRFPGGTSSAVAAELDAVAPHLSLEVHAFTSKMFKSDAVSKSLAESLDRNQLNLIWDARNIAADTVIVHNPSFLKFESEPRLQIFTRHLVAVCHENFSRPGGAESFDVASCLSRLEAGSLATRRSLAPVSPWNRETIERWLQDRKKRGIWSVLSNDWHNIFGANYADPTEAPRNRRGRHSRPGLEKFPSVETMDICFPESAESNVILGGDNWIGSGVHRPHWTLLPFQSIEIEDYFDLVDFMVYFTAPTLRESFGRVLAEAIAAGKLVISDPATAAIFEGGVIAARPDEVDGVIQHYIDKPQDYGAHVREAQKKLGIFAPDAFLKSQAEIYKFGQDAAA